MSSKRLIAILATLCSASCALAGLSGRASDPSPVSSVSAPTGESSPPPSELAPVVLDENLAPRSFDDSDSGARSLPPPPSSLSLAVAALASVGAYQAGRSLRRMHFGVVPDWYHEHAKQVGHSTPYDFGLSAFAICVFAQPRPAVHLRPTALLLELLPAANSRALTPAVPRGPPLDI